MIYESPHHLANIPIKQSQKLITWVKEALPSIYATTQQTDFPKADAKSVEKMELQIRSSWLLIFCLVWYWPVPPTLRTILFLDFSFTRCHVHHPLNFLWDTLTWDWNGCPQELGWDQWQFCHCQHSYPSDLGS